MDCGRSTEQRAGQKEYLDARFYISRCMLSRSSFLRVFFSEFHRYSHLGWTSHFWSPWVLKCGCRPPSPPQGVCGRLLAGHPAFSLLPTAHPHGGQRAPFHPLTSCHCSSPWRWQREKGPSPSGLTSPAPSLPLVVLGCSPLGHLLWLPIALLKQ